LKFTIAINLFFCLAASRKVQLPRVCRLRQCIIFAFSHEKGLSFSARGVISARALHQSAHHLKVPDALILTGPEKKTRAPAHAARGIQKTHALHTHASSRDNFHFWVIKVLLSGKHETKFTRTRLHFLNLSQRAALGAGAELVMSVRF
jgi:hypothetical protein